MVGTQGSVQYQINAEPIQVPLRYQGKERPPHISGSHVHVNRSTRNQQSRSVAAEVRPNSNNANAALNASDYQGFARVSLYMWTSPDDMCRMINNRSIVRNASDVHRGWKGRASSSSISSQIPQGNWACRSSGVGKSN